MIKLKDFSIGFGDKLLLKDISAFFPSGKLISLIGRNGTGKSTLMKAIGGINKRYLGEILIYGENIRTIPAKRLASEIAYVNTQRPRMANLKCRDVVALGRSPYTGWHGNLSEKDVEIIKKAVEMVGMNQYLQRELNSLSDGESQKIMIARAIAQDTKIILLDEPTSFLDLPTRHELASLLQKLAEDGKTIIFSTHELEIALRYSDYIALINNQTLTIHSSQELKNSTLLNQAFPNI